MKSHSKYDVVVVGGGAIGLAVAWRAAQRGLDVCVLDRSEPGAGATGVAAGMLAPVGETSWGEERLLEMNLASARQYPDFVAALEEASGIATGHATCGALHVALDRDEEEALRRRHELQRGLGLEAHWLAPSECRELEPGLSTGVRGGIHAPAEAAIDPRALVAALVAGCERAGVRVERGAEVTGALLERGRLVGVETADARAFGAGTVVLAAGCWSGTAEWLPPEARPAVRPVKGQVIELRAVKDELCERIVASERMYAVPRADGRVVVGATVEEQGFDLRVTAGGVHELLREAYRALPEVAELELVAARAGLRPGTPDNLPLVGAGAIDGLVLATGHFRNGVLLTPLTADAVASLLCGEPIEGPATAADPLRLVPQGVGVG